MKKLLFLLFPIIAFSQTDFKTLDSLQFKQTVDQLVKDTGRNYQLVINRQDDDKDNIKFVNVDDKSDILLIKYGTYMDGENKDFEVKGIKKWAISTIYGKYLALFPIYKKYVDPAANIEAVNKKGFVILKKGYFDRFNDEGFWRLGF
ncbi:hypothetical protein OK18_15310 [Chryseobacterium gallinarum]|uniref:Uncharacterized protein n=1 Tax=Chryseobacterium gallinarum TaxID=1324352 RepID=A0A0G3M3P2_CHRGL|nr:hypothetical protein [Chryseobacterium gallinarum]AKK73791.1 hypothetical protein OK18_15310 [Chryseobacterium gallinarum]